MKIKPRTKVLREEARIADDRVVVTPQIVTVTKGAGGRPTAPTRPVAVEVEPEARLLNDTGKGKGIGQIAIIALGAVVLILLLKGLK